jgi:hypothetical protein
MATLLESESSPSIRALTQQIETQSDQWWRGLAITGFPIDAATWGVLTGITLLVEEVIEKEGFGSRRHREAMINLSRSATLLLDWLRTAELAQKEPLLRWTSSLSQAVREAEHAARNYESFVMCFTMFHKERMSVEVLARNYLRFHSDGMTNPMQRRVRAYQQGIRRPGWPATLDEPTGTAFVEDQGIKESILALCGRAMVQGALAVEYPTDYDVLGRLYEIYLARLETQFRRNPQFNVGGYTLDQFRHFFAALLAICSVHEHFCFAWEKQFQNRYPSESVVMVKTTDEWVHLLSRISSLSENLVTTIVHDMTFGSTRTLELYTHPFFPTVNGNTLYLSPHFILNSRAEENILRICSHLHPELYGGIAAAKENEMRELVREKLQARFQIHGPIKLPAPLPDIDLVIEDRVTGQALIGELKWGRKTLRAVEHTVRDEELRKGVAQLRSIRDYLLKTSDFLKRRGVHATGLCYTLVGRDHLVWIPPEDELFLCEFDALIWILQNSQNLDDGIRQLKTYDWLPVEGVDFVVRHERVAVAGVSIETEVFHQWEALQAASSRIQ